MQTIDDASISGDHAEAIIKTVSAGGYMEKSSWEKLPLEQLNHLIGRQMVSGENATVARLLLKRGAVVPRHFHVSEQFSLIFEGKLRFVFDDREIVVGAGEVLLIPANVPHSAVALEDTVDLDFFAPRREDWIRKEDAYLREGNAQVSR
jgi:quercetin dioxygenase-like cupin family protein